MYQVINEPVDVIASFRKDRVEPVIFKWNNRYYRIASVNLVHTERKGRNKMYIFSVTDSANAFRLRFSTETMKWQLEEMAIL